MTTRSSRPYWRPVGAAIGLAGLALVGCTGLCVGFPCFSTGLRHGLWLDACPDAELRLEGQVRAMGLVRGFSGEVQVTPEFRVPFGEGRDAWTELHAFSRGYRAELAVLDEVGVPVPGFEVIEDRGHGRYEVRLPAALADGEYTLRATLTARGESVDVDAQLPLYAPALAHLATDRPLYRPGQEVLLRSVLFRRTDLTPLEGRPGRWRVLSPSGEEVLVERDKAGPWGIADSSFPLDRHAEEGTWTAVWESGAARDEVQFDVRPFSLPRLTAEVSSDQRWYAMGDTVTVEGTARYASGGPVRDAVVEVRVRAGEGRWPPPLEWEGPHRVRTDASGRFSLRLGQVPADLVDRAVLQVSATVTEEAGESTTGTGRIVLSQRPVLVEAVTELGDGLVGGFNNRAYLRLSSPDGVPLTDTPFTVINPWQPDAPGYQGRTDEDGVGALQLDPGDPVTVVIPPPPHRPRPVTAPPPTLSQGRELTTGAGLSLAERRALDGALPAITDCALLSVGGASARLGVQVAPGGQVLRVVEEPSALGSCVGRAVRGVRFPLGSFRTYDLSWSVPDPMKPSLSVSASGVGQVEPVVAALREAAVRARPCLAMLEASGGETALTLQWRVEPGEAPIEVLGLSAAAALSGATRACVLSEFERLRLREPVDRAGVGSASLSLVVPRAPWEQVPQATTETGYELEAWTLSPEGERLSGGRIILPVGNIPAMRLRASPPIARAGEEVEVELLRGPDFYGELPEELELMEGSQALAKAEVEDRRVRFTLPEGAEGFLHVEFYGARAVIYARPVAPLRVSLSTDRPVYRPGEEAVLTVRTERGGAPVAAAVGLMGVDATLGQLAPLLGPDDQGRVTVRARADAPAFGAFDPKALVLGQVRGDAAARAAVLRVTQLPMDPAGDEALWSTGRAAPDHEAVLTNSFYRALDALLVRVRAWEESAPTGEEMTPARMVAQWQAVLADERLAGRLVQDAFGRELTLDTLPLPLLELVDPRRVVLDGTRLPEDVVGWQRYVDEEVGR
ncbi:MAG: hypothetical protein JXX28_12500 [Deltaproteobacteria bacterium]|nr:hypothetical protein [Deltaproteobacteria bacterium]